MSSFLKVFDVCSGTHSTEIIVSYGTNLKVLCEGAAFSHCLCFGLGSDLYYVWREKAESAPLICPPPLPAFPPPPSFCLRLFLPVPAESSRSQG